jgi:hypothetical protein
LFCVRYLSTRPILGVSQKTEKPRKSEKNNWKNRIVKKNQLNRLKFWKNRPVRFYKPKTEKTEPNPNRKKTKPNRKNRVKPVWTGFCPKKLNQIKTDRFEPVLVFFFLNRFGYFFSIKTESKMIAPSQFLFARHVIKD